LKVKAAKKLGATSLPQVEIAVKAAIVVEAVGASGTNGLAGKELLPNGLPVAKPAADSMRIRVSSAITGVIVVAPQAPDHDAAEYAGKGGSGL